MKAENLDMVTATLVAALVNKQTTGPTIPELVDLYGRVRKALESKYHPPSPGPQTFNPEGL